ncbi:MAG TPA: hypothetical protein DIS94_03230, partial [Bacteroidetes bacterium]|nr:hypothetical protein [Bacteroidota bacterium]
LIGDSCGRGVRDLFGWGKLKKKRSFTSFRMTNLKTRSFTKFRMTQQNLFLWWNSMNLIGGLK